MSGGPAPLTTSRGSDQGPGPIRLTLLTRKMYGRPGRRLWKWKGKNELVMDKDDSLLFKDSFYRAVEVHRDEE